MIRRFLRRQISDRLKQFPAVALLGPRQSGKTTLAKTFSSRYFDLEQPEDQLKLDLQWDSLVRSGECIILDEGRFYPRFFPGYEAPSTQNENKTAVFFCWVQWLLG